VTAPSPPKPAAVALSYDRAEDAAPRVVASGHGEVAERIVALAKASGVAVHEDPDLVELLAAVDLGATIPVEAFVAVAQILSHLYRLNQRAAESR
jgi:flagellar biosynthesis protein